MPDDTKLRGGQDRTRINLDQDHEVRYWTKELGVTTEELREELNVQVLRRSKRFDRR